MLPFIVANHVLNGAPHGGAHAAGEVPTVVVVCLIVHLVILTGYMAWQLWDIYLKKPEGAHK